ncbi:hypothetical protein Tco_1413497 [Tanacetum coccineum]
MRAEHSLRKKKILEEECAQQTNLLKEKDAKIASLKSHFLLNEAEAAEAILLSSHVATVEATEALHAAELNLLKEINSNLEAKMRASEEKAAAMECLRYRFLVPNFATKSLVMSFLKNKSKPYRMIKSESLLRRSQRWILSRGLKLVFTKCLQSPEYLSVLGKAIGRAVEKGMQDGLVADIEHGKDGRALSDVAAYNPFADADYVAAVSALRDVDFSLLTLLASQKDASIADIIDSLHLEGPAVETLDVGEL